MKRLIKKIYNNIVVLFKPLSVHVEAIVFPEIWEKVKLLALSGKVKRWYIMTPANYTYLKSFFNLKISKKEMADIMEKRYKWLINNNQKLELHVHLNRIMNISKNEQERLIRESMEWGEKNLGIRFKEFVPGWWMYNKDTEDILKKYNLKKIKKTDFRAIHDYDLILGI